jgi:RNA polymerase sigma factor (sigma-70 family)
MAIDHNHPPDNELMRRFYNCQEEAFDLLARRWWRRLFGLFVRLGFTAEAAEDLTQEAIVRLYGTKETQSFDVRQPLAPFFIQLARNLAIATWRTSKGAGMTVPLEMAAGIAAEDPAPVPADLLAEMLLCVSQLPEPERTYISLCGKHGLGECSHNDICELLGKWPAQITAISQRARAQLRTSLEAKGFR